MHVFTKENRDTILLAIGKETEGRRKDIAAKLDNIETTEAKLD